MSIFRVTPVQIKVPPGILRTAKSLLSTALGLIVATSNCFGAARD
jgi:hypothetical protein